MDQRSVYTLGIYDHANAAGESNVQVLAQLEDFILTFRLDNKFVYR